MAKLGHSLGRCASSSTASTSFQSFEQSSRSTAAILRRQAASRISAKQGSNFRRRNRFSTKAEVSVFFANESLKTNRSILIQSRDLFLHSARASTVNVSEPASALAAARAA